MRSCELSVKFDKPGTRPTYAPGERVTGEVVTLVQKNAVHCEGLDVTLGWSAGLQSEKVVVQTIFRGTWSPGIHRCPFAFVLPQPEPESYTGKHLSIGWWIDAHARRRGRDAHVLQWFKVKGGLRAARQPERHQLLHHEPVS